MSSRSSADRTSAPRFDAAALRGSAAWKQFDIRACHEVPFSQVLTSNDPLANDLSLGEVSLAGLSEKDHRELGHLRLLEDVFDVSQVTQLCPLASVPDDDSFAEYFVSHGQRQLGRISALSSTAQLKADLWSVWRKYQQDRAKQHWPHGIGGHINEVVTSIIRLIAPTKEVQGNFTYCVLFTYGLKPTVAHQKYLRQQRKPAPPSFDAVEDPAQIANRINARSGPTQSCDVHDTTIMAWQRSLRQALSEPQVSNCLSDWLRCFDARCQESWPDIKRKHQKSICPRPSEKIQRDTTVEAIFSNLRLHNILLRYGINTLNDLLDWTTTSLGEFKGNGVGNVNTIRSTLAMHGIILPENSLDELVIPKHLKK